MQRQGQGKAKELAAKALRCCLPGPQSRDIPHAAARWIRCSCSSSAEKSSFHCFSPLLSGWSLSHACGARPRPRQHRWWGLMRGLESPDGFGPNGHSLAILFGTVSYWFFFFAFLLSCLFFCFSFTMTALGGTIDYRAAGMESWR